MMPYSLLEVHQRFGRTYCLYIQSRKANHASSSFRREIDKFISVFFISFLVWGETESLATSATNWPIVPAPDDRWWWVWSSRWNENWQGKPKYSEKAYPSATLSTTNPTWPDLGSNPGRRGGKPATNRLSYGTASTYTRLDALFLKAIFFRHFMFLLNY
jgi:hypothetical protein